MTDEQTPLLNVDDGLSSVVIAVDASSEAERVITTGARVARPSPTAIVHLIHVFKTSRFDHARAGAPRTNSHAIDEAKDYLESQGRVTRKQCRNQVVTHLVLGDPSGEVLKLVQQVRADLLVVGTHDHTGLDRLLLGSHAETLLRKARCSVLIVRRKGTHR